jgi:hypothetical protein
MNAPTQPASHRRNHKDGSKPTAGRKSTTAVKSNTYRDYPDWGDGAVNVRSLSTRPGLLQWPPVEPKYFKATESDPNAPVIRHLDGNERVSVLPSRITLFTPPLKAVPAASRVALSYFSKEHMRSSTDQFASSTQSSSSRSNLKAPNLLRGDMRLGADVAVSLPAFGDHLALSKSVTELTDIAGVHRTNPSLSTTVDLGPTCSTILASPYSRRELSIFPSRPTIYSNRVEMSPDLPLTRLPVHNPPDCFHSVPVLHVTSLIFYAT